MASHLCVFKYGTSSLSPYSKGKIFDSLIAFIENYLILRINPNSVR